MSVTITSHCEEQEFIQTVRLNGLLKFNLEKTKGKLFVPDKNISYVARNENGAIIGGVYGAAYLSSVEIEVLWVHESFRGQGIALQLLSKTEEAAPNFGCRLSHLSTYSFQAPLFYQKCGYSICGTVDGFPDDIKLYLLKKQL